jgi:hypothetical protein
VAREETDRGKQLMAEVTGWSLLVRAREGEGRRGLAGCGAGLGVPRRRACRPGSARGGGGAGPGGPGHARGVGVVREVTA